MVQTIEGEHRLRDGHMIYTKIWKPDTPPKAKLIFVHGYSDHCNRYYEFFPTLTTKSIEVFSFDQRGWGRSVHNPSQRGLTGPTSLVISDLVHIITAQLPDATSDIPVFVMGHSMGGAEILTLACSPEHSNLTGKIRGWLTESAHIAFPATAKPSRLMVLLGRLVAPILPNFPLHKTMSVNVLSRDPSVQKSLSNDPLCHNTGTLMGLADLLERASDLNSGKKRLNRNVRSLWMAHGTGDECSSCGASEKFCREQVGVEDRVFKGYEGWSHQMHADLPENRLLFANDVAEWILSRSGTEDEY